MRILALDDEKNALLVLVNAIREVCPEAEIVPFRKAQDALDYLKNEKCEIVFLDIEMPGMNGIEVAKNIKMLEPKTNIIFQTGYSEYRGDAFSLHASGYVTKPVCSEDVRMEIENLRFPVEIHKKGLRVQAFGHFEVFYDNVPLEMGGKVKELFAYLIDCFGASISNNEMYAVLYEDEEGHEENLKKIKKSLYDTLKAVGCEDVLVIQRGKMAVNPDKIDCDYFHWKNGRMDFMNSYRGEYMEQYSWAEYRFRKTIE